MIYKENISSIKLLFRLFYYITPKRRLQSCFSLFLMITSAVFEIVTLSTIIPFLAVLISPEKLYEFPIFSTFSENLNLESEYFPLVLSILFASAALLSGFFRLLNLWFYCRLSGLIGSDMSKEVYKRTIYQPYKVIYQKKVIKLLFR